MRMLSEYARKGINLMKAHAGQSARRLRSRCGAWSRDFAFRSALARLDSPEAQQRFAHDVVRGGRYPAPESESFEFMCHVLGWHRRSKSQLWQDVWALYRTGFKRSGFFVDVGASDGVQWSNTYLLEKDFGWRGVLIEPNPLHGPSLASNRASRVHQACVAGVTGEKVAFWCARDVELSGIGRYADQDSHAAARRDHSTLEMPTVSLVDALRECDAPTAIDYVSLDTEGSELDILSGFDFDRYRVKLWTIEHNHSENEAKIDRLMLARGYVRELPAWSQFDAWYVSRN
ncbi:MAG TPA: FkbM family methyltransferase [Xanthobacteraceae bacterium]|nr:FkbM family methyltransferase [Xanthobacteraceae bacterium]